MHWLATQLVLGTHARMDSGKEKMPGMWLTWIHRQWQAELFREEVLRRDFTDVHAHAYAPARL